MVCKGLLVQRTPRAGVRLPSRAQAPSVDMPLSVRGRLLGHSDLDNSSPTRVELSAPAILTDTGGQSRPLWSRRALKNGSLL